MRFSDVKALRWDNIVENGNLSKQQKTETLATIPVSRDALRILGLQDKSGERVFYLPHVRTVNRTPGAWAKAAGIDKSVTTHVGRHSFAAMLINNGADVTVVSKLLGHSGIRSTLIYARVMDSSWTKAVALLPDIG